MKAKVTNTGGSATVAGSLQLKAAKSSTLSLVGTAGSLSGSGSLVVKTLGV